MRRWRVLFRQHGSCGPLHHGRLVPGIRRTGLGPHRVAHSLRRCRGSCQQSDQDRPGAAEVARGQGAVRQSRENRLLGNRRRVARDHTGDRWSLRDGALPRTPEERARRCLDDSCSPENAADRTGMMHAVIANARAGDPYPIDTLFMCHEHVRHARHAD